MARSYTFPADNVSKAAIIVQGPCRKITVVEDKAVTNWPTQGYRLYAPLSTAAPVTYNPGDAEEFTTESRFIPGQTIGYITTTTSATTMAQKED